MSGGIIIIAGGPQHATTVCVQRRADRPGLGRRACSAQSSHERATRPLIREGATASRDAVCTGRSTDGANRLTPNAQPPAQPAPPAPTHKLQASDQGSQCWRPGDHRRIRLRALREANSLDEPKPAGFDFRRFVLTTDISPNDRLQAYIEIEFERFGRNRSGAGGGALRRMERRSRRSSKAATAARSRSSRCGASTSSARLLRALRPDPAAARPLQHQPRRRPVEHPAQDAGRSQRPGLAREGGVDRTRCRLPSAAWTSASRVNCCIRRMWSTARSWISRWKRRVETEIDEPGILKLAGEFSLARGPVNGEGGTRAGTWRLGVQPDVER